MVISIDDKFTLHLNKIKPMNRIKEINECNILALSSLAFNIWIVKYLIAMINGTDCKNVLIIMMLSLDDNMMLIYQYFVVVKINVK